MVGLLFVAIKMGFLKRNIMDKGRIIGSIIIAVGLVVMGSMLPKAVEKNRSFDRTVTVKGLCEEEVRADKVIWPIVYRVMADDLNSIYQQIDANNAVVKSFLNAGGVSDSEITVAAPVISDKYASEYGNNDRAYRYVCKSVVTVCTQNVDTVLTLMASQSDLIRAGIVSGGNDWENPVEFKYEGLNDIKPMMIEKATENAREAAKKFAKDSNSRLGKIKTANQGTFTIENRDSNTPEIKRVRVVTSVTYYLKN